MSGDIPKKKAISFGRLALFILGAPFSLLGAWPIYERYSQSEEALSAVAGVCATFAGFIVAMLTILGDATALLPGSWRLASSQAVEIHRRSLRLQFIFYCYLLAAFSAIFVLVTVNDFTQIRTIIAYFSCSLIIYCVIVSFELPNSLNSIKQDRLNAVVETRREAEKSANKPVPLPED